MPRIARSLRVCVTLCLSFCLVATGLTGVLGGTAPAAAGELSVQTAASRIVPAADLSRFNPGNIIADEVFFNASTMTEEGIAAFLRGKVPNCQAGYTCLKDFAQATVGKPADAYCAGYQAETRESAARIILKVAQSCGINPQALIVTLQKEQGLVTHTWPSDWRYTIAMGQGCPDTAACDTRYYGFQNQVYGAARQFKIYAEGRYFTYYAPGKTWNILFNPNKGCGSGAVFVANKATAGLYYYTPYQPNAAALRAGYGEGDSCSAYGNRNFYQYFTDWFGSTTIATHGAIANLWASQGGGSGWVGGPVAEMVWDEANGGGWYQRFANATIYYAVNGASAILKSSSLINSTYEAAGRVRSSFGWPTAGESCAATGCYTPFQHASLAWSSRTGAVTAVAGSLNWAWRSAGAIASGLGAPLQPEKYTSANGGGWSQTFSGGSMYLKVGGSAQTLPATSSLAVTFDGMGGPASGLGWPLSGETCAPGVGCAISFEGGALSWDKSTGSVRQVVGAFGQRWVAGGAAGNWIGTAISEMRSVAGGWIQDFRNGTYYLRAGGTLVEWKSASALHDAFKARGGVTGALGWPASSELCGNGACTVTFDNGQLMWDAGSGALATLTAPFLASWQSGGVNGGWIGLPQRDAVAVPGGVTQEFRNAFGYAKSGAVPVYHKRDSALAATYRALGGPTGDLGWPTGAEACSAGQCVLAFERGSLVWAASTGLISRQ